MPLSPAELHAEELVVTLILWLKRRCADERPGYRTGRPALLTQPDPLRLADFDGVRLTLARFLALALEFQLGADILSTAVALSWDAIGKLGAIAVIRTGLNYFLSREMQEQGGGNARTGLGASCAQRSRMTCPWLQIEAFAGSRAWGFAAVAVAVLSLSSCASIGPYTVPRDRIDYISAVGDSWKGQTLLNIVRLRYGDAPSFVDVSSVISAYTLQGQLLAGGQLSSDLTSTIPSRLFTFGGNATYVDRPTITYTPLMGDRFARSLLRPIPPSAIFELIQAGYPADAILQMTTRAINGVYNRSTLARQVREADPEFYPVLDALRRLQVSGSISLRLEKRGADEIGVLILSAKRGAQVEQDLMFLRQILGITPGSNGEVTLAFGALPRNKGEIALLSRSMLGILLEIANGIAVPDAHVQEGRTAASTRVTHAEEWRDRPMIRILSGATEPPRSFAAVHYRDTWYWVSDDDLASKRIFTFLMMFFSLAETGVTPQAPVLTIPAN